MKKMNRRKFVAMGSIGTVAASLKVNASGNLKKKPQQKPVVFSFSKF